MSPRRSRSGITGAVYEDFVQLVQGLRPLLASPNSRDRVRGIIPLFHRLRDLGASVIDDEEGADAARHRILKYLRTHVEVPVAGEELMVVSGIGEWARRVRELRSEGWHIVSGSTIREMMSAGEITRASPLGGMQNDDYALLSAERDEDAPRRWDFADYIRKTRQPLGRKVLAYFEAHIGQRITAEEIRHAVGGKRDWAEAINLLRSNEGWPIVTRTTGGPDLPAGTYVMVRDTPSLDSDRGLGATELRMALENARCALCGWVTGEPSDEPRYFQAHRMVREQPRWEALCTICYGEKRDLSNR
jgi:hypothetical protein